MMLTVLVDAQKRRDVMMADAPNAFIQTELEKRDKDGNRLIMKIRSELVDILCMMDPTYKEFVEHKKGKKALYVWIH